jgi:hypothetical protein
MGLDRRMHEPSLICPSGANQQATVRPALRREIFF